jgi:L-lactate dehydrogenase (cytochrome)/(S)-mandelate dehydrogenase
LIPRALVSCLSPDTRTTLFGQTFSLPFGIAPTGLSNLIRHGTDLALASAGAKANIPYSLSTAGTTSIEKIAKQAREHTWFQLYVGEDPAVVDDLLRRAAASGLATLLVTADVPAPGKRVRDIVNGLSLPLRPSLPMAADVALHPQWLIQLLKGGMPELETISPYFKDDREKPSGAQIARRVSSPRLNWDELSAIRDKWAGPVVLKGVLNPRDAERAAAMGLDGIVVSNHGGRQLDCAPATIDVLPLVKEAVGGRVKIIFDSGIRSGDDIARALVRGADFVLAGRAFLYAVGALGLNDGPARAIEILRSELLNTMAHLGCETTADLRQVEQWPGKCLHCG